MGVSTLVPCVPTQIRELEPVLCHAGLTSQLIWTSSSNAHPSAFSVDDIQHRRGTQPYSSSKYACDLLSLALNTHYNKQVGHTPLTCTPFCGLSYLRDRFCFISGFQGLYSSVTCPGFVMTSLTYGILPFFPPFLWTLLMPLFWLVSAKIKGFSIKWIIWSNELALFDHFSLTITDKNFNQHFHVDTLQWSWGLGW